MPSGDVFVVRAPSGDGPMGGGGGPSPGLGNGGTGPGIQHQPTVIQTVKPPNAVAPPPGASPPAETRPKIQAFGQALGGRKHTENWKRKTNLTGTGATHVRSFHCKLNAESLEFMDRQINEWLDEHPDYEVKFVNAAVGEWTGKIKEPALIVSVWV